MQVQAEDVTVPWGRTPDPLDQQTARWRVAVFQDMQPGLDATKLYWLYDPIADENSGTTGGRKGGPCILVFDTNARCFVREIPLPVRPDVEGVLKYFFPLKSPSPAGGTAFVLCTQFESRGIATLQFWRVNLSADGLTLAEQLMPLLHSPVPVGEDWIVCMREDAPELALLTGPGLTVWRINAVTAQPSAPIDSFSVPDGDMRRYYDGFIHGGRFYLLASTPNGTFDFSHVHMLDVAGRGALMPTGTRADPMRGFPPPRKQTALDCVGGMVLLAGGELEDGRGGVHRLLDYWSLNLATFEWRQLTGQMPVPLIEPRLTANDFSNIYIWGDFDQPLPGVPNIGTHVRILKMSGFMDAPPSYGVVTGGTYPSGALPSYQQASSAPAYPPMGGGTSPPYSAQQQGYPPRQQPPYGQSGYPQQQQQQPYGQPNYAGPAYPPSEAPPGQQAYYPPSSKSKDCCIS